MKKKHTRVAEIKVSYRPATATRPIIVTSEEAYQELVPFFPTSTIALQERFVAMYLNRGNKVLGVYQLSQGGVAGTVVDVRLLLSVALKTVASGILLCHNHPSGNPTPSDADLELTRKVSEACRLFDIRLIDHLIITQGTYLSFADKALL
jgi:DNA repair protein RadC